MPPPLPPLKISKKIIFLGGKLFPEVLSAEVLVRASPLYLPPINYMVESENLCF